MWNQRLDVSFAMKTLLAPDNQNIELVRVTDDQRNAREMKAVADAALKTPEARPASQCWRASVRSRCRRRCPSPAADDYDTRLKTIAASVAGMLNLQNRSRKPCRWHAQLEHRRRLPEAVRTPPSGHARDGRGGYRRAGLDMQKDFAALAAAPRIQADAPRSRGRGTMAGEWKD